MLTEKKIRLAILGTGNIGTDLLIKSQRSRYLECVLFAGRNLESKGLKKAKELGINISYAGIESILSNLDAFDLLFDATSAKDHLYHWSLLKDQGKVIIDMTPSHIGKQIIPTININQIDQYHNVNMVSCGGQASIPIAHAISQLDKEIEYIEVVSSIASDSAGLATRVNIDEYIENTENALRYFTQVQNVKKILILNPAQPCIDMQTTLSLKMKNPDIELLRTTIIKLEKRIQEYVPGYQLVIPPVLENGRVIMSVRVRGLGDYLPTYAGNLDIINCAAIATAEKYAEYCFPLRK